MRDSWKTVSIGDLCESISETYKGNDETVVLINTSDVLEGEVLNHTQVPNHRLKGQFKKTFRYQDILYSEIRPMNKRFAFVDFHNTNGYIASTKLMVLRSKSEKVLPEFLFDFLKSQPVVDELQYMAEDRSATFPQITFSGQVAPLRLMLPDLETQAKIISFMRSIEDKIKINNTINKNLQEQAITLFKQYCITENTNSTVLGNYCSFVKGKKPLALSDHAEKGYDLYLTIDVLTSSSKQYAISEKSVTANAADILMVMDGASSGSVLYGKSGVLGSTLARIDVRDEFVREIIRCFLIDLGDEIKKHNTGSAIPHADKKYILQLPITIPTDYQVLGNILVSLRDKIITNKTENERLSELRDALLPKLMSGEIDVSEIDI